MALKLRKVYWTAKVRENQNAESLFSSLNNKDVFPTLDGFSLFSDDLQLLSRFANPELLNLFSQEYGFVSSM